MVRVSLYILLSLTAAFSAGAVEDQVYPSNGDITCCHEILGSDFRAGDTITIIRDFINNSPSSVGKLYLSEHMPPSDSISIISHNVMINGSTIDYQFYKEGFITVIDGNDSYYWLIDSPLDGIYNSIDPGDSLHLEFQVVILHADNYLLPMHTTVFQNSESAFFATTDAKALIIDNMCGDINSDDAVNMLDITYLIDYLYCGGPEPNPPEMGNINGDESINLLDITYLISFLYLAGNPPICQ